MGLNEAERVREQQRSLRRQRLKYGSIAGLAAIALLALIVAAIRISAPTREEYVATGDDYVRRGHYAEAVIEYRNAIDLDPSFGDAHAALARAYLHDGDVTRGVSAALRAAELLPENLGAQVEAARFLLLSGRFEEARSRADAILQREPRNVAAHLIKASALARMVDLQDDGLELLPRVGGDALALPGHQFFASIPVGQHLAEAEAELRHALMLTPASVDLLHALAAFYLKIGRVEEAEAPLRRAVAVDPTSLAAHRKLAAYLVGVGRTADLAAPLERLAASTTASPPQLLVADLYIAQGRTERARAILERLARKEDTFVDAKLRLARLNFAESAANTAYAHRALSEVLAHEPANLDALLLKVSFLLREGDESGAVEAAEHAVSTVPGSAEARSLLAEAYASNGDLGAAIRAWHEALRVNPALATARVRLAQLYLRLHDGPLAARLADDAVRTAPGSVTARLVRAQANTAQAAYSAAARDLMLLTEHLPDFAAAHTQLGELELKRRNLMAARRAFDRARELEPASFEALQGLVTIDLIERRRDQALLRVEQRIAAAPDDAAAVMLAASLYEAAGDAARLEATLVRAVQIAPDNLQPFQTLTRLYLDQGRVGEAIGRFEALARGPAPAGAQTMLGFLLESQRRTLEAQSAYERALSMTPDAAVAANNLAWIYLRAGSNLDQALQLAQAAARRHPESAAFNNTLGWAYVKKDRSDVALVPLQLSVRVSPNDPQYRYHLGMAYLYTRDKVRAAAELREALRLQPDYSNARRALETLSAEAPRG